MNNRKEKNIDQIYMDENYWYHKGVVLNAKQKNEYALNCYKQALNLNPRHKASIFNLACAYEKLEQWDEARSWFLHAIEVDDKWPDAHYGLVLCSLKLEKYQEAVEHIEKAKQWSIVEYQQKVDQRKRREKIKKLEEMNTNSHSGNRSRVDFKKKVAGVGQATNSEDEDTNEDALNFPDIAINDGIPTHVMYVHALCYRKIKDYGVALLSYSKIMKSEDRISDYEKMLNVDNKKNIDLKIIERPGFPGWKVDLYSHFKRLKIVRAINRCHQINLRDYYEWKEGFSFDFLDDIVRDL